MVTRSYHGGGCCGRRHLSRFYGPRDGFEDQLAVIQREHAGRRDGTNLVTEVVLTDSQRSHSERRVEAAGFVKVARWRNSNSGNFCNMYLHARDVSYMPGKIYAGCRVRNKRTGTEGTAVASVEGGRISVRLDNGSSKTWVRSSVLVVAQEL